jgi:hypothetical protein
MSGNVRECDANDDWARGRISWKDKESAKHTKEAQKIEVGNRTVERDVHKTFGQTCMDAVDPRYVCWEGLVPHCIYSV